MRQEGCEPFDPVFNLTLTSISYIGLSVSIVCLILTIITMLIFKYVSFFDNNMLLNFAVNIAESNTEAVQKCMSLIWAQVIIHFKAISILRGKSPFIEAEMGNSHNSSLWSP